MSAVASELYVKGVTVYTLLLTGVKQGIQTSKLSIILLLRLHVVFSTQATSYHCMATRSCGTRDNTLYVKGE